MPRLALFFATSGHSGVDRGLSLLVPELLRRGVAVDLLKIQKHGPHLDIADPAFRQIELPARHVQAALPALVRYLKRENPTAVLSGKDRANRTLVLAHALARSDTRLYLRMGTNLGQSLAHRGPIDRTLTNLSVRHLYRRADRLIAASEGVADDLRRRADLPADRVAPISFPVVKNETFHQRWPAPEHPWFHDGGPPLVLGVGELSHRKGFDLLLQALARLQDRRACRLMLLGEGRERASLQRRARELDLEDHLAMPGFRRDVHAHLAHCDVFALSSRWEGLGFSLIEALAAGTPVVATDCPSGPRQILQDGRIAPLVPVNDADALADALDRTLADPPPRDRLQAAARPYEAGACTHAMLAAMGLAPSGESSTGPGDSRT